ncbi:MAG: hypothetical protein ABR562_04435 [Thermoplasmatota archaeon]
MDALPIQANWLFDNGGGAKNTIYASSDGRLVRIDQHNTGAPQTCNCEMADWSQANGLLPAGIDWPTQVHDAQIELISGLPQTRMPNEVSENGDTQTIQMAPVPVNVLSIPYPTNADYAKGDPWPIEMNFAWPIPVLATRTSFIVGEGNVVIDAIGSPVPVPAEAGQRKFMAFPDEESDVMGLGFTPRQAEEFLFRNQSEAKSLADDGCIYVVNLGTEHTTFKALGVYNYSKESLLDIGVAASSGTGYWQFAFQSSLLESGFTRLKQINSRLQPDCAARKEIMPLTEALAAERQLRFLHRNPFISAGYEFGFDIRPSIYGSEAYRFSYQPDDAECNGYCSYYPHHLIINANTHTIQWVELTPAALALMDADS